MEKSLPVYNMIIDTEGDSELNFVSLVPNPAIEKNFLAFSDTQRFEVIEQQDRKILSGPLMLADTPIYRRDDQLGEYNVMFDSENIYKAVQKFFTKGYQANVNLFHDMNVSGVTMFESWIVDSARGIAPMKGFEDAKDGSWFGSFIVNNENVWNMVKSGQFKGFSIEGMFGMKRVVEEKAKGKLQQIRELLEKLES